MILTLLDFTVGTVWQCDLEAIKGWSSEVPKEFYENLIIEKGFDLDNKNHYPWSKIPKGRFIIPKILIKQISGKTILTYFKTVNQKTRKSYLLHDFNKEFYSIKNIKSFKKKNTQINLEYQKPNKNDYLSNIQDVIKKINNKRLPQDRKSVV